MIEKIITTGTTGYKLIKGKKIRAHQVWRGVGGGARLMYMRACVRVCVRLSYIERFPLLLIDYNACVFSDLMCWSFIRKEAAVCSQLGHGSSPLTVIASYPADDDFCIVVVVVVD